MAVTSGDLSVGSSEGSGQAMGAILLQRCDEMPEALTSSRWSRIYCWSFRSSRLPLQARRSAKGDPPGLRAGPISDHKHAMETTRPILHFYSTQRPSCGILEARICSRGAEKSPVAGRRIHPGPARRNIPNPRNTCARPLRPVVLRPQNNQLSRPSIRELQPFRVWTRLGSTTPIAHTS